MNCPLCNSETIEPFVENQQRRFLSCHHCSLIFVPEKYQLKPEAEKAEYDLHTNDVADKGYRKFLSRLTIPLLKKLPQRQSGLDFGCGPGPALAAMLEEEGHRVELFDIYYRNNPTVFSKRYDFICATEVVEHLRQPQKEFDALFSMLKPGGWLGLMTKLVRDQQAFKSWHYIRDLTHICFYSRETFIWLADKYAAKVEFIGEDVILMQKSARQDQA